MNPGGALNDTRRALDRIGHALAARLAENGRISQLVIDREQVPVFEYVWLEAQVAAAQALLVASEASEDGLLHQLAALAVAEAASAIDATLARLPEDARDGAHLDSSTRGWMVQALAPGSYDAAGMLLVERGDTGDRQLDGEHELLLRSFQGFADDQVRRVADEIHRRDLLVPEPLIQALRELGCFGLSIPQRFGGFQPDTGADNVAMVVVTEELSRGSLGAAGSLITRPEILAKALLRGGTPEQQERWLPAIAAGDQMVAVAVTEPDFGSDVANLRTQASRVEGGWVLRGAKTWCTFGGRAEVLLVLARTDPDLSRGHRGLSMFLVEKPAFDGREFRYQQPNGGRIYGRAIPTPGYRGMHSFDVVFEDYFVPAENLVGGEAGEGRGFYLQMEGFAGGRLQTAGRALGVMQAAFDAAVSYVQQRSVFGRVLAEYPLPRYKIARMGLLIAAARQLSYHAARETDAGRDETGALAAIAKLYASRQAEWVTREAQQLHGGVGYAEEHAASRYFADARVFAIFEGAEEVLALRVVARPLLARYLEGRAS